jgi:hypothetical protein
MACATPSALAMLQNRGRGRRLGTGGGLIPIERSAPSRRERLRGCHAVERFQGWYAVTRVINVLEEEELLLLCGTTSKWRGDLAIRAGEETDLLSICTRSHWSTQWADCQIYFLLRDIEVDRVRKESCECRSQLSEIAKRVEVLTVKR